MKRKTINYKGKNLYKEQIAHLKGYYIDKTGDVFYQGRKREPYIYERGYKEIKIRVNNTLYSLKYHRLQAYQKYGDKIYKKGIEVRHLDNNPSNNSFDNIAIGTSSQNKYDSLPEVRQSRAQIAGDTIRIHNHQNVLNLHRNGFSYSEIMSKTGINNKGMVSWIINHSTASKQIIIDQ